jgi:hypothetical protein
MTHNLSLSILGLDPPYLASISFYLPSLFLSVSTFSPLLLRSPQLLVLTLMERLRERIGISLLLLQYISVLLYFLSEGSRELIELEEEGDAKKTDTLHSTSEVTGEKRMRFPFVSLCPYLWHSFFLSRSILALCLSLLVCVLFLSLSSLFVCLWVLSVSVSHCPSLLVSISPLQLSLSLPYVSKRSCLSILSFSSVISPKSFFSGKTGRGAFSFARRS